VTAVVQEGDGDRGIPSLTKRKGGSAGAIKIIVVLGVLATVVAIAAYLWLQSMKPSQHRQREDKSVTESKLPPLDRARLSAALDESPPLPAQPQPKHGVAEGADRRSMSQSAAEAEAADLVARRQRAPLMIVYKNKGVESAGAAASNDADAALDRLVASAQAAAGSSAGGGESALGAALNATTTTDAVATRLRDPSMTLTRGTTARCALNTAIDSTVPGFVSCTLIEDVFSTDGRFVLLERGSLMVGEYDSAKVKQGMARVFVLWQRIETRNGVVVDVNSPATDGLGRGGVGGHVDTHFWSRFGSGIVLSLVDDASAYAGAGGSAAANTSQSARDAASIAVENSVNIPPTLTVQQGALVTVFLARDLFFGDVYGKQLARD
jgi:type IV secretion system protein VirB10